MPLEPGHVIGVYEIVGPLGAGGMGEVYRARDTRLGRLVAIKLVSSDLAADSTAAGRLAREARLTSSLNHPNIVTVHDVGEIDGRPYIVMELVDGQSLYERLAAGPLKLTKAVDIACQVADGLAAAHGAGMFHRDLKPRNIMVTEEGRAKIVDFGLGKTALLAADADDTTMRAPDLTDEHMIVGTAGYMAPEQVTGHPVDFHADQFALGAVIYEMLTGQRAFKRDTAVQTMAAIVETEPKPLAELCPAAPPELVTVVERCLAKDPANRYDSTRDLARDLHDVKTTLTIGHRSGQASRSTTRLTRRPRRGVVVAAVALVVVVVAAGMWVLRGDPVTEARALLVRHDKRANVQQAVSILEAEVSRRPNDVPALVTLAEAYVRFADRALTPDATQRKAHLDRASELCRTAQTLDANDAPVHVVWAMINFASLRYDGAVSEAERAVALAPSSARAWQELGLAKQASKDLPAAEKALQKGVSLAPDDWWARHLLGRIYLSTNRPKEAAAEYEQAYARAPDSVRVLNNLGTAYFSLGDLDKARGVYQQSLSVEPTLTAYSNLGLVLYDQGLYEEAAIQFEQAVAAREATSVHWGNLAAACHWVSRLQGREREAHEKTAALVEAELKVAPTDALKATLASAYSALGRTADARRLMAELQQRPVTDRDALYTMALVHEQWGDRAQALDLLARAAKAGYSVARMERSPFLKDLRTEEQFSRITRQQ